MSWQRIIKRWEPQAKFFYLDKIDLDDWEKAANELITLAKNTAISDREFEQQLTGLEVESQKYLTTSVWQLEEQLREYYEKVQKILKLHEEFEKLVSEKKAKVLE